MIGEYFLNSFVHRILFKLKKEDSFIANASSPWEKVWEIYNWEIEKLHCNPKFACSSYLTGVCFGFKASTKNWISYLKFYSFQNQIVFFYFMVYGLTNFWLKLWLTRSILDQNRNQSASSKKCLFMAYTNSSHILPTSSPDRYHPCWQWQFRDLFLSSDPPLKACNSIWEIQTCQRWQMTSNQKCLHTQWFHVSWCI